MTDRIRVGVIGASPNGSWGTRAHLPALAALSDFEVTAVATAHQETAEQTASQFGIKQAFGDPRRLAECPDVDVVSICVRVPAHLEMVEVALAAGKHVYCEWPLARNTAEAEQLCARAAGKSQINMIGLQARCSPIFEYARDLIADGHIGRVLSCALNHSVDWMPVLPPSMTYLQDINSGAHMLSIPGGHSLDALCWLLGDFHELSATVTTQIAEIDVAGTGEKFPRTSPDQVLVNGTLTSGVVAGLRIQGSPTFGTGVHFEINGEKGDLVISLAPGGRGIQMADLRLRQTSAPGQLQEMTIPDRYVEGLPESIRSGPPLNVARAYRQLAEAIRSGVAVPDFAVALQRHRLLDRVQEAAREGRRITL